MKLSMEFLLIDINFMIDHSTTLSQAIHLKWIRGCHLKYLNIHILTTEWKQRSPFIALFKFMSADWIAFYL